jgi:hypothetical protein
MQGYMYNILSESDYKERMLPPTPPRHRSPEASASSRPLIEVERPYRTAQERPSRFHEAPTLHCRPDSVFRRGRDSAVRCSLLHCSLVHC